MATLRKRSSQQPLSGQDLADAQAALGITALAQQVADLPQPTTGAAGASAYQVAVAGGYVGTETQWLASLRGADGAAGAPGASAYQVAVAGGYVGTETQWLASLRGADGAAGAPGASAYQVAVAGGYVGTETQWLASVGRVATRPLLCAVIGDSRNAQNKQDLTAGGKDSWRKVTTGALTWLQFLSYQKIDIPWFYNLAVPGAGTAAIALQVAGVLALPVRPALCFINGGTNSFASTPTYAQSVQSLADISGAAVALRAAGIEPVIELDHPRALASWSGNAAKASAAYNRLMREWCYTNGYRCADVETVAAQMSGASAGEPVTAYMLSYLGDVGVHRVATGAIVSALAIKAAIDDLLSVIPERRSGGPADAFDAAFNPVGSAVSNGLMNGTAGTNTGTGASGPVPDGWNNRVVAGTMTCVSSLEARTDGRLGQNWVQTISASVAGTTRASPITNIATTGKYVAGDSVVAEIDMEISALSGPVEYCRVSLQDYDGTSLTGAYVMDLHNSFGAAGVCVIPPLPLARNTGGSLLTSIKGRIRTPPMVLGQGMTSAQVLLRAETSVGAGGSVTVKWGDAILRKA